MQIFNQLLIHKQKIYKWGKPQLLSIACFLWNAFICVQATPEANLVRPTQGLRLLKWLQLHWVKAYAQHLKLGMRRNHIV